MKDPLRDIIFAITVYNLLTANLVHSAHVSPKRKTHYLIYYEYYQ